MVRRLAFGYALIATVWCAQVFALGLGDIKIHSALNQKLDADIDLLDIQGMSESEILAQLATTEDFKRVGIERFFFLTGLQFQVRVGDQNHAVLHVTSTQPITEPYLNFLVQVVWPNGRLLKEYTVLLDPPMYKDQAAPAVASPGRSDPGGGSAGRVERTPTRPDSQVSLSSAPRSNPPATQSLPLDRLTGDSYGVTDRDDTLWRIAQRTRPADGISVQQNMLAIERLNPEAFIGGNINLLKAGYTLQLPKAADVAEISATDAISEVAAQNEAWQAYRRGEGLTSVAAAGPEAPADATSQSLAGQVDATAPKASQAAASGPEGELRIVAGDAGENSSAAGGNASDAAAIQSELAAAKEEAERAARERDEAVSKLDDATSQAEQAKRQIEVKNQQIAQMQAQLKAAKQAEAAAPTPAAAKQDSGGIAAILASPFVLGGAALVVVLLIVAGLLRARGRREADDHHLESFDEAEPIRRMPAVNAPRDLALEDDQAEAEEELEESPQLRDEDLEHDLAHHEGAQTSDVIGEADIYIAYGRYPQAVSLLLGALDEDPDRSDVRVKLLEVYAETKDEAGFETQMTELLARCDDNELLLEARELETKLREDGPLPDAVAAVAAEAAETASSATPDDFQLDLEGEDETPRAEFDDDRSDGFAERAETASDDLGGDLGIDFKADAQPTLLRPQASAVRPETDTGDVAVATDDGDEFDLEDLEFEPAARAEASREAEAAEESDDAFEFLNEEDAATTKLDLARAYIDMGDEDGAREILGEVLQEGSNDQQATATELLAKLG